MGLAGHISKHLTISLVLAKWKASLGPKKASTLIMLCILPEEKDHSTLNCRYMPDIAMHAGTNWLCSHGHSNDQQGVLCLPAHLIQQPQQPAAPVFFGRAAGVGTSLVHCLHACPQRQAGRFMSARLSPCYC